MTALTGLPRSGWGFSTAGLITEARQRVGREHIDQVAVLGGLTKKEMAQVLGVTERNLYNQHQGDLSVPMSERLILLERVFQHGLAVFDGNRTMFTHWLRTPLAELATPETGFIPTPTDYQPIPIAEMGTKNAPPNLLSTPPARRSQPTQPSPGPTYPTPLSLLDTVTGCSLVDRVFTRIEAGVFS